MKDPIHRNDIYVGVAWFCYRSFLFSPSPSPPPTFPPASFSSSAPSCRDAAQRNPSSSWNQDPEWRWGHKQCSDPAKLRQGLTWAPQHWDSCLPTRGRALPHVHKWNFLRSFIYEGEGISWHCAHSGNAIEAPGSGMKPPIFQPSSLSSAGCERGWETPLPSLVPGPWFHFCLIQTLCQRVWGWGGAY